MTKEEMKVKYTNEFLKELNEFIADYAEMLREEEPHATNTISKLDNIAIELPQSVDEI